MTPEELDGITLRLAGEARAAASTGRWDLFADSAAQAIREAVAEETERCAAICDQAIKRMPSTASNSRRFAEHVYSQTAITRILSAIRNTTNE